MNRSSLESTLGRSAPLATMAFPGWRRVFNAPFDDYSYLNLRPVPGAITEAAYFELDAAELGLFDEREAGSELGVDFTAGTDWPALVVDDTADPIYR